MKNMVARQEMLAATGTFTPGADHFHFAG